MEGVPYISVSLVEGGTPITWDTSNAGEEVEGVLVLATLPSTPLAPATTAAAAGTLTGVDLINTQTAGSDARATVVVLTVGGAVTSVTITSGGSWLRRW